MVEIIVENHLDSSGSGLADITISQRSFHSALRPGKRTSFSDEESQKASFNNPLTMKTPVGTH